jgi:hypothetical protein
LRLVQRLPQLGVLSHAIAVAANRDQVAVVDQTIDERRGHHVIAKDIPPFFKAFIAKCVLPTPGGPRKITFSRRSTKPSSWRLSICSRRSDG